MPSGWLRRRPQATFFSTAVTAPSTSISARLVIPTPNMHEHQRPAAADAERAVRDPHRERLAPRLRSPPAGDDEAQRRPALVEAAVAERAELPQPGDRERRPEDQLRVLGEPRQRIDRRVDPAIEHPRTEAERRPRDEIAGEQQPDEEPRPRAPPDECPERHDERDARGQHHREDHQDPARGEQRRLDRDRRGGASVVAEVRPVRRARPRDEADPRQHREADKRPRRARPGRGADRGGAPARTSRIRPRTGSGPGGRCCRSRRRPGSSRRRPSA